MAYNVFRSRMNSVGNSAYDRALTRKSRDFQNWFNNTLSRQLVLIDGIEQYAVVNDQNQNNNKDLSDDKYIVVPNDSNMKVGSTIGWRNRKWLVFTEEEKTIPTHRQAKLKPSNADIKWMYNGAVCGKGEGHPAYVQNNTLYTLGVSTSGNQAWVINAKYVMFLQDSVESRVLDIGSRVIIGGNVYQIMFRDYVSRNGLINFLLEEDFVNPNTDNIELGVANYYSNEVGETKPTTTTETNVAITGVDKARIGTDVTYTSSVDIVEWSIVDTEGVATVNSQSITDIKIHIVSNFQKVGSTITVIGKTADGSIGSKTVNIISPY